MTKQRVYDTNRKRISEAAEVSPEQVRTIQVNLRRLREEGALVAIHCYGMSITERGATRAERGISDDDVRAKSISSGRVKTLPSKLCGELLTLRELSRSRLDDPFTSFNITGFKPWKYIPVKRFSAWLKSQHELEAEWVRVKLECVRALPAFRKDEMERWEAVAKRSWASLWANASKKAKGVIKVDGHQYTRNMEDVFTARLVDHALACIPTASLIGGLELSWEVAGIETSSALAREVRDEAKAEAETAEARVKTAAATEEVRAMQRVVSERLREQLKAMPDPGVEMIQQLRGAVGQTARSVRESLEEKGRFYKGTSNAVTSLTEKFDAVNPGDDELEVLIARLRASMYRNDEGYNYQAIRGSLEAIEGLCNRKNAKEAKIDRAVMELAAID